MTYCRDRCYDRETNRRARDDDDDDYDDDDDGEPTQDYNQGRGAYSKRSGYNLDPVLMDLDGNGYQRYRMTRDMHYRSYDGSGIYQVQSRNSLVKDRAKIKTVTSNANILSARNPDIFATPPRPGGFMKIKPKELAKTDVEEYMDVCERCTKIYDHEVTLRKKRIKTPEKKFSKVSIHPVQRETESREFRIRRALEENDWETTVIDETDTIVGISNTYHFGMNMLAVTITCVMMMAAKIEMTMDYLDWAENYLECIKDDNGKLPRNITGILKEIEKARSTAIQQEARTYKPRSQTRIAKKRNDQGCRIICDMNRGVPGQCTATSSCTANKNLCSALRIPHPCPHMKMPKCDVKCGHIATIDDYVSPTPSQKDKSHV
ncbi:uncharacterized protein [Onthophagus taurus]|uniref:uncharacterized protein n=1 Tax=Onthophagus taurus TaxID=166361 RepID=UPI000C201B09|nr:uncharacterized protein LOC111427298 [Onthophagus taurus]